MLLRRSGDYQIIPSDWHLFWSNRGAQRAQDEQVKERQLQPDQVNPDKDSNDRQKAFASSLEKGSELKEVVRAHERRCSVQSQKLCWLVDEFLLRVKLETLGSQIG